jgi:hypothetical protein
MCALVRHLTYILSRRCCQGWTDVECDAGELASSPSGIEIAVDRLIDEPGTIGFDHLKPSDRLVRPLG